MNSMWDHPFGFHSSRSCRCAGYVLPLHIVIYSLIVLMSAWPGHLAILPSPVLKASTHNITNPGQFSDSYIDLASMPCETLVHNVVVPDTLLVTGTQHAG